MCIRDSFVLLVIYAIGILLAVVMARLFCRFLVKGDDTPFVMELPNYRLPSPKSVALLLWDKAKDFLQRAFGIIFVATIVIWFLQNFDTRLNVVENSADSLLAMIGRVVAPIFEPLGFGDWRAATSLISGFTAKEAVISTMAVLLETNLANLGGTLSAMFTPLSAVSFLVFTLLYTPCVAAIASIRRELGSKIQTAGVVILQCGVAWICAFLVFRIGLSLIHI